MIRSATLRYNRSKPKKRSSNPKRFPDGRQFCVGLFEVERLRDNMGGAYPLDVPLEVSVGYGLSWDTAAH